MQSSSGILATEYDIHTQSKVSLFETLYVGPHHITGNGVGFKPDILDMDVMEQVLMVSTVPLSRFILFHLSLIQPG